MSLLKRPHVAVIGAGYITGVAAFPWLPGPYLGSELPFLARAAIAFLMPTAALVIYSGVGALSGRMGTGESQVASAAAVRKVLSYTALFVVGLHVLILVNLVGLPLDAVSPARLVVVLTGLLLIAIGNVLPKTRPNQVIGIRTGRLLTQPRAWARVHRVAGYVCVMLGAVMAAAGIAVPGPGIPLVLSTALLSGVGAIVLAYARSTNA